NYVYKLNLPYSQNHHSVDFLVHGGFRKVSWTLTGCFRDTDGDLICDEHDPDIDNDGIPNANDNCPYVANPGQEATLDPGGVGDACWHAPIVQWGKGLIPDDRIPAALAKLEELFGRHHPDPCDCRGLCLTCPAEFSNYRKSLKDAAERLASGKIPSKT